MLEVAVGLTGAEKGLLLAQRDGDGDGKLDLVCHRGFKRDPGESSVAQRFAECVVERDTIIREDAPGDGAGALPTTRSTRSWRSPCTCTTTSRAS